MIDTGFTVYYEPRALSQDEAKALFRDVYKFYEKSRELKTSTDWTLFHNIAVTLREKWHCEFADNLLCSVYADAAKQATESEEEVSA